MHSANLNNSKRLQRVLGLLSDGKEHSTLEIVNGARVCAVNSVIAELRDNGIVIACQRRDGVFFYRLVKNTEQPFVGSLNDFIQEVGTT